MKLLITLVIVLVCVLLVLPFGAILLNRAPLFAEPGIWPRLKSYLTENHRLTERDSAFPELRPRCLPVDEHAARIAMREAADSLGWSVAADRTATQDELRLVVTSALFRFKDDVTLRLRRDECLWLEVDSRSRVGRGDLGANLRHILRISDRVSQRSAAAGR